MEFKDLFQGIDSLYVSYRGTLKKGLKELLDEKKKHAQSENEKEQALATVNIEDHCFEVSDKGARYYSYILVDNWYQIKITASKKNTVPTLYVQIASELLNCLGPDFSIYKLREIVNKLLVMIKEETISRADIFVDFVTDRDLEEVGKQSLVTKVRKIDKHWDGGFTGWSIGLGGIISARLYEKTVEMKKSNKEYLKEIWAYKGWEAEQRVWRLEFQLERTFLGQMSVKTYSDLLNKVNDVWKYCTSAWLRLAIDDNTQNRTRWKTDPLWEMIQQVRFLDGSYAGVTREVNKARIPSNKILYQNGIAGYMTSYAAREGHERITEEVVVECWNNCANHLDKETRGKAKDYISTRIKKKMKVYNMALNPTLYGQITNLNEKPQP